MGNYGTTIPDSSGGFRYGGTGRQGEQSFNVDYLGVVKNTIFGEKTPSKEELVKGTAKETANIVVNETKKAASSATNYVEGTAKNYAYEKLENFVGGNNPDPNNVANNAQDKPVNWGNRVTVYASAGENEKSGIESITDKDKPLISHVNSKFTNELTSNMDYIPKDWDKKKVESLDKAFSNTATKELKTGGIMGFGCDVQHPVASWNKEQNGGWVPKGYNPEENDPERIAKAIIVEGDTSDKFDYSISDGEKVKNKLVDDYGLKYNPKNPYDGDIIVLKNPTKEDLQNAENRLARDRRQDAAYNYLHKNNKSQVMVYYSGHGSKDALFPVLKHDERTNEPVRDNDGNLVVDDNNVIKKSDFIRGINNLDSSFDYVDVILESDNSEGFFDPANSSTQQK